jgi:hypothetical protein
VFSPACFFSLLSFSFSFLLFLFLFFFFFKKKNTIALRRQQNMTNNMAESNFSRFIREHPSADQTRLALGRQVELLTKYDRGVALFVFALHASPLFSAAC